MQRETINEVCHIWRLICFWYMIVKQLRGWTHPWVSAEPEIRDVFEIVCYKSICRL